MLERLGRGHRDVAAVEWTDSTIIEVGEAVCLGVDKSTSGRSE